MSCKSPIAQVSGVVLLFIGASIKPKPSHSLVGTTGARGDVDRLAQANHCQTYMSGVRRVLSVCKIRIRSLTGKAGKVRWL